ncbi:MAG TPA: DUF4392 domain-containing protein [Clostridia bacterium]|nr:DUF4392 domain-containing protein [Clostridia bacterium]
MYHNAAILIEQLIKNDAGGRGLGDITQASDIVRAAEELYGGNKILIITGFCIAETLCGETDGPLGAATLACALEKLGKTVMIVTDRYSENILSACTGHMKVKAGRVILPYQGTGEFCSGLLDSFKPSHVVSVERPGKAKDGRFYSMKGADLTHLIPDSDSLFESAKLRGVVTIAVGDGGNELGMGKVRELVVKCVDMGETIAAVINADYTIVAGVSNWGAHGLEAMLSMLAGRILLQETETERALIMKMVEAGAVDGCTKRNEPTVDGLSLEQNVEVLSSLRKLTADLIQK